MRLILHADALLQKHLQELAGRLAGLWGSLFGVRRIRGTGTETALRHRQHTQAKETRRRQLGGHPLTRIRRTEIIHLRLHAVQRNLRAQPRLVRTKNRTVRGCNHQVRVSLNSRTQQAHLRAAHTIPAGGVFNLGGLLHGGGKRLQVCGSVQESMRMLHRKHLHPIKVRVIAARHPRRRAVLQAANVLTPERGAFAAMIIRHGQQHRRLKLTGTPAVLRRVLLQGGKLGIQQTLQAVLFAVVLDRGGHPVHDRALLSFGVFGGIFGSVFGDEFRDFDREGKRCRRIQACRALVAGQKIGDALGKFRRFYTLVQRLGEQQEALLLQANQRQNTHRINPVRLRNGGVMLSGLRIRFCAVLICAALQVKVEAPRILGALGCTSGQQVRRQGTAQQRPMRRLTQVRGADDSGGITLGGAARNRVVEAVELNRVGQPRRGGRHQGHRVPCAARMLTANYSTANHSTGGQRSQAFAVRFAGALGLLGGRVGRLLLRALPKLCIEPQLAGGGCGQISEGESKVHSDFCAGGERNKAGVKPCRVSGREPRLSSLSAPRTPSLREVDFRVSRETLQKINLRGMILGLLGLSGHTR